MGLQLRTRTGCGQDLSERYIHTNSMGLGSDFLKRAFRASDFFVVVLNSKHSSVYYCSLILRATTSPRKSFRFDSRVCPTAFALHRVEFQSFLRPIQVGKLKTSPNPLQLQSEPSPIVFMPLDFQSESNRNAVQVWRCELTIFFW